MVRGDRVLSAEDGHSNPRTPCVSLGPAGRMAGGVLLARIMAEPIVQFEQVTKRFPGVVALAGVSFAIERGECHAIVGENGAGKSTLGRIAAGIHRPDDGRLIVEGRPVCFRSPRDAADAGVSMVHQELAFCPNLSIAENLFLGRLPTRGGFVRRQWMLEHARTMLAQVGLPADPDAEMGSLATAQEQLALIATAVGRGSRIVIMDEPTSSLSGAEADRLFDVVGSLRKRGVTVVYVSHRIEEIMRLADRVTVLRDGRYVGTWETRRTTPDEIVRLMIGRTVEAYFPEHLAVRPGESLLGVEHLSARGRFEDVSFTLRAGEIVGLAGLVGSGRSELARAIFGVESFDSGRVLVAGKPVRITSPREAIDLGIGLLPEDRKRQALVQGMGCGANLSLSLLDRLRRGLFLDSTRERRMATEYMTRLCVRAAGPDAPIDGLSGGNQQKIAIAKWLATRCRVLILDEPTRGVDVGAKAEIHTLIDRLAADGHAVLLISSELPEVLHLSTRILVLAGGRLVGELSRAEAAPERVMRMMTALDSG